MKTSIAVGLALGLLTAGCSDETTMVRKVVAPSDAAAVHAPSARVIAIEHADGSRSKPSTHVTADDRVVVEVPGARADADRGERLVRYHESKPMMLVGVSMIGLGGIVAALSIGCKPSGGFDYTGACIGEVIAAGSSLAITGIVLMVAGSRPHPYVEKQVELPRVQLTPTFDAHGAGGVFRLTF